MKIKALNDVKPMIAESYGEEKCSAIVEKASLRFTELCKENAADPKAVKAHTQAEIFPCMSLYEAMQSCGIDKAEALEFLDKSWSRRAEAGAESISRLLHFASLYKLYPAIFGFVARHQYGSASGFQAKFYDCPKGRCRFDMTKCIYMDTCKKYGCPELTVCFCHVDDINNSNLHPRLCWNRSQYMGGGGEYCDFDIFVKGCDK